MRLWIDAVVFVDGGTGGGGGGGATAVDQAFVVFVDPNVVL